MLGHWPGSGWQSFVKYRCQKGKQERQFKESSTERKTGSPELFVTLYPKVLTITDEKNIDFATEVRALSTHDR
jgi:hypothetical protein